MFLRSKFLFACLSIIAIAFFGVGCGDDDDDNGGGGTQNNSTSVEGSAELGSLSQAQMTAVCGDVAAHAASTIPNMEEELCTILGIAFTPTSEPTTDEEAQQACSTGRDQCLADETDDVDDDPNDDDGDDCLEDAASTCTATVDEFMACQRARNEQFKGYFDEIPACSELTLTYLEGDNSVDFTTLPTECDAVQAACPSLFADDDPA